MIHLKKGVQLVWKREDGGCLRKNAVYKITRVLGSGNDEDTFYLMCERKKCGRRCKCYWSFNRRDFEIFSDILVKMKPKEMLAVPSLPSHEEVAKFFGV